MSGCDCVFALRTPFPSCKHVRAYGLIPVSNWIPLDLYTKLHEKKKKKSNFINGVFQFPEATSEGQPFLFLEVMSNIFFFSWNTRMQQRDCSSMRGEK